MKDKAYKRAFIFMCALIVISVLYGGIRSVGVYRNTVIDEYNNGGAAAAADGVFSSAYNLLAVAKRYIADDSASLELSDALSKSENQSIVQEKKAVENVIYKSHALYKKLGETELTETDEAYRVKLFYNIKSYYSILCKSDYNRTAAEYNRVMKKFPARLFFSLSQKSELPGFFEGDIVLED